MGDVNENTKPSVSRTSNKAILDAIQSQTASIDKLIGALTKQAMPESTETIINGLDKARDNVTEDGGDTPAIEVPEGYLAKMTEKAANHATAKGQETVLYARKNQRGDTKLAYALRERFDTLKDNGLIGAVGTFQP